MAERDLVAHVLNHRDRILRNMRIVSQEVQIPIGRIDLIAIDKDKTWVIIEAKTTLNFEAVGQVMAYAAYFAKVNDIETMFLRKMIVCTEASSTLRELCEALDIEVIVLKRVEKLPRPSLLKQLHPATSGTNLLMFACNKTEYQLLAKLRAEGMATFATSQAARLIGKPVTSMPFYLGSLMRKGFVTKTGKGQYCMTNNVWKELSTALDIDPAA